MNYVHPKSFFTGYDDDGTASVSAPFWIGETEVTYELWYTVRDWAENGVGPAPGEGDYVFANKGREGHNGTDGAPPGVDKDEPVAEINWRDAMIWCNALTEYYNSINVPDLVCVYYTNSDYSTPIRTSTNNAIVLTDGEEDQPYIKASANGNTDISNCTADGFRLPTSDEWELTARYITDKDRDGGITDTGEYYPGNYMSGADRDTSGEGGGDIDNDGDEDTIDEVAVHDTTATAVVKSKDNNALGLYDMSGNVEEWCFGWDPDYFGSQRIKRGGGYTGSTDLSSVYSDSPEVTSGAGGLRVSRVTE
jgi:formylglycine-generating enzyme required for sulfatase activity